ncbi:AsmA family protein [Erwinia sp. 9145]|uniref:AsmA family protein n=1 Tax=Erwinia sp. 9145 TaxID=1500895 RepID=UPI000558DD39|nr:AsmA family protein [Erwinia sp. 9145]
MKLLGKILLSLLLLILLAIVIFYFLLQTQWGAGWISRAVSKHTPYQLTFSKLEHNFSDPAHLIFNNVSFGREGQAATVTARRVDLGVRAAQFTAPQRFGSILLEKGTLNIDNNSAGLPLEADRLQLNQMAVNNTHGELPFTAQRVDGGILDWKPARGDFIGNSARFQMSAGSLDISGIPAANVLIQGSKTQQQLVISNLGADLALGSVTGSAIRDAQGQWQVSTLRLNSIRLQSEKSLSAFLTPIFTLPAVHFDRVDVTDARLEGADWAITDFDMVLKNITLRDGDWESDDGSLSMNANGFVNGDFQLNDPIANMTFSRDGVALTQFSSRFADGLVRTTGKWTRNDKKLTLDEMAIAGLEYTLPRQWRERWMARLPDWLSGVEVTRFEANRNLIIDINPDFPFQMTSLEGSGSNLLLAHNHQWGMGAGRLSLNAAQATWNGVDVRHPSITLNAEANAINVTEMSAFTRQGMIEGVATLSQQPQRALNLSLNGRQVPVNLLQNWGWPALPLEGNGDMQLKINASLAAGTALRPTVNGTLSVTAGEKSLQQTMQAGQVVGAR